MKWNHLMHTIEYCMLMKISFRWHFKSENRALLVMPAPYVEMVWNGSFFSCQKVILVSKMYAVEIEYVNEKWNRPGYLPTNFCIHILRIAREKLHTATLIPLSNWIYHDKFTTQKVGHKTEQRHILCLIPRYYEEREEIEPEIKTNEGLVMTFLRHQPRVVDFKRVQSEPMFTAWRNRAICSKREWERVLKMVF